ncbi:MAG: hypothetical protein ACRCUY_09360 [Thermoguttaceae bacterium]
MYNALIDQIHDSPVQLVICVTGGGSLAISDLLSVPGASRTLLEAAVPYSVESLNRYIGHPTDQTCCVRTACNIAMTAFHRGMRLLHARKIPNPIPISHEANFLENPTFVTARKISAHHSDESHINRSEFHGTDLEDFQNLVAVSCTASLETDREKKGANRVHVAVQTIFRTAIYSITLKKGARSRFEEERLVSNLILNVIATALPVAAEATDISAHWKSNPLSADSNSSQFGKKELPTYGEPFRKNVEFISEFPISLELKDGEHIQQQEAIASPALVDLFFGHTWAVLWKGNEIIHFVQHNEPSHQRSLGYNPRAEFSQAIFPGSFNPIHQGHLQMVDIAQERLGSRVALEIATQTMGKPPLDYIDLQNRLNEINQSSPDQVVWVTRASLFEEKSRLFIGPTTFIVGADTLKRFSQLSYYHHSFHQLQDILRMIAIRECRFLVFARKSAEKIETLESLDIPDMLRTLSDSVPESIFAINMSSRDIRKKQVDV